eukprot:scaffold71_cov247-Pinguiococcus_pyrenoidosus.AAC.31
MIKDLRKVSRTHDGPQTSVFKTRARRSSRATTMRRAVRTSFGSLRAGLRSHSMAGCFARRLQAQVPAYEAHNVKIDGEERRMVGSAVTVRCVLGLRAELWKMAERGGV